MALVSYDSSGSDSEPNTYSEKDTNTDSNLQIKKGVKKRIKIPVIPNYESDEEPSRKIIKKLTYNHSDLFSVLPRPKHKPKDRPSTKDIKFDAEIVRKTNLVPRMAKTEQPKPEDDIENTGNFFSITPNEKITKSVSKPLNIEVNSAKPASAKTNAYFSSLVSKKSAPKMNEPNQSTVKIVDINSEEFKNDWKLNALKQETSAVDSEPKEEEPTHLSRKKHQITYLAYQAKKNEEQLKNQWALNKISRKQTQARYGF